MTTPGGGALKARLREIAPTWERAAHLYGSDMLIGGYKCRRYLVLLSPAEPQRDRVCRECRYRWPVKPHPGLNVVPLSCPQCQGEMRWDAGPIPLVVITVAPGSGIQPRELVEWGVDFERWVMRFERPAVPDPAMLVRLWCRGHYLGNPPQWRELAEALENYLGMAKRPHYSRVWRCWETMQKSYEN